MKLLKDGRPTPETELFPYYNPLWKNDLSGNWIINDELGNVLRVGENFGKGRAAAEERAVEVNYFNFLAKIIKTTTPPTKKNASLLPRSLPIGAELNKAEPA